MESENKPENKAQSILKSIKSLIALKMLESLIVKINECASVDAITDEEREVMAEIVSKNVDRIGLEVGVPQETLDRLNEKAKQMTETLKNQKSQK